LVTTSSAENAVLLGLKIPSKLCHQPSCCFLDCVQNITRRSFNQCIVPGAKNPSGPTSQDAKPRFNPGFTPHICYIKEGQNTGLNPGLGVLRCGLYIANIFGREKHFQIYSVKLPNITSYPHDTHAYLIFNNLLS
jgi:hypothetical protein